LVVAETDDAPVECVGLSHGLESKVKMKFLRSVLVRFEKTSTKTPRAPM
jgi:hypothetical protein